VKDAKGNPQFRIVDKADELTPTWSSMLEKSPDSYPWIVLSNGPSKTAQPLPTDWDELTKLLNQYAGVSP